METLETKTFGISQRFGMTLTLRAVGTRFEVVRRGVKKGSRDCVLSRHSDRGEALRAYTTACELAAYYENGLSDRYAARMESGNVKTVVLG